jgi:short-subunit dehydrogenase
VAGNDKQMKKTVYYTLITGGSEGIGNALAMNCAKRGLNLLIIALDNEHLLNAVEEIRNANEQIQVAYLGIDLSQKGAAQKVFQWCKDNDYQVNMLINNAGFGRSGWFEKMPLEVYQAMIQLNNQALFELCYHFIPELKKNQPAHIMNMSSLEAYLPLPYKAAYTATKHFVFAYSLALREELKQFNINVSVLCPGSTITNEDGLKRIQSQGKRARIAVMMPEPVAEIAIAGLFNKKQIIIPGRVNKLIAFISKVIPVNRKMKLLEKLFRSYVTE